MKAKQTLDMSSYTTVEVKRPTRNDGNSSGLLKNCKENSRK